MDQGKNRQSFADLRQTVKEPFNHTDAIKYLFVYANVHQVQLLTYNCEVHQETTSLSATSTCPIDFLSLFQWMTTLSMKKFFLIVNRKLHRFNLRSFPLILSPIAWEKRPTPTLQYWHECISELKKLFNFRAPLETVRQLYRVMHEKTYKWLGDGLKS